MSLAERVTMAPAPGRRLTTVPHLSEPWYCCAEPTELQLTTRDRV